MIILAFDSTAKIASVAICDDDHLLGLYNIDNGLTQSELLLPMAENMLSALKMSLSDVGMLAVSVGPGSFTGVRIGTALVKGLAFGRDIPCVGVSTLDELAENLRGLDGIIAPCMDARRSQVYNALYRSHGGYLERITDDRAISLKDLAHELAEYNDTPIFLTGDGESVARDALMKEGIVCKNTPKLLIGQNAYSVAQVARAKYLSGEYTNDLGISPTYLRMPQAERERLEKLNQTEEKED